jgi:DNA ligase-associated metallophosphoesterase
VSLPVRLADAELVAMLEGALWWPARRLLAVADLHLEKGSAFARRGVPLPPYDTRATLARLARLVAALSPAQVVCVGDSFHDASADARLDPVDAEALRRLTGDRDWVWIAGNHDEAPPTTFGGRAATELAVRPLVFRHAAQPGLPATSAGSAVAGAVEGEVSGHYHPKASVVVAGRRTTARCFVSDPARLILPAFGAYTGGLDVFAPAIARLLQPSFAVLILGHRRVHRVGNRRLSRPPGQETG